MLIIILYYTVNNTILTMLILMLASETINVDDTKDYVQSDEILLIDYGRNN